MRRTFVLAILDGWGIGKLDESNPIYSAKPETINFIRTNFPSCALQSAGNAVGLPWEEEGNSEVGHLTLGAGKILYQYFPRISMAISDGSFFENPALKNAFAHSKKNNSAVHLVGLLTDGNVHASFEHLRAILEMAKKEECSKLYLQIFADGKDSSPRSVIALIKKLDMEMKKYGVGQVASLSGRYFAMDRDNHWERTEATYKVLTGINANQKTTEELAQNAYDKNHDDEYIEPSAVNEAHPIKDDDAIIFFNFREDSMRQITEPFVSPSFTNFPIKKLENIYTTTMTEYLDKFKVPVAFKKERAQDPLGKILADKGKTQLRIAETEKYAHVTYFFNGLNEIAYQNEYRILIPSRKDIDPTAHPEMMAHEITERAIISLNDGGFDFILINYANPDVMAHTGNFSATTKAVQFVDKELSRLIRSVLDQNHVLLITSDLGNAESVINLKTGEPQTQHDPNPVPFYLVAKEYQGKGKNSADPLQPLPVIGLLSDVAPTILELMNIPQPQEMTGQSLLNQLL